MGEISPLNINKIQIRKEVLKMDLEKMVKESLKEILKEELFKKEEEVVATTENVTEQPVDPMM